MQGSRPLPQLLRTLCATLALLGLGGTTASAQSLGERANGVLGLTQSDWVQLNLPTDLGGFASIEVPIHGQTYTLEVIPRSMRTPDFRVVEVDDRVETVVAPGLVETFRGTVVEERGSVVAGGLLQDGLWAQIVWADGTMTWVEPLFGRVPGAAPEDHVVYAGDAVIPAGDCGVLASTLTPAQPFGAAACGGDFCLVDVACDADFQFYSAHASSTSFTRNRIELILNIVSLQYERDIQVSFRIGTILVRTSEPDPFTSFDPATLLDQFQNEWQANQAGTTRDLAHLFTGRDMTGSVIGYANIGVVCTSNAYGLSQSDYTTNFASATDLTAHEIGHNWDGTHCTCSSPAHTMNPSITGANRFNATETVPDLIAHRSTRLCLSGGVNNDLARNALVVCAGTYVTDTTYATQDGSTSCGLNANLDVWFLYTPRFDGSATFDTEGSTLTDTVLSVHSEAAGTTVNQIGCNDDGGTGLLSSLTLPVVAGTSYLIRVAGYNNTAGAITLNIAGPACEIPINNACADAIDICPGEYYGNTVGATNDGEASCGTSNASKDVWFRYEPRFSGLAVIDTCDSEYDTAIGVYASCPGTLLTELECDDDGGPCGLRSRIEWSVVANADYYIRVSGFNNASGAFILSLSGPQCDYDNCGDATIISSGTYYGSAISASNDGEASCGGSANSPDIFYRYTAPYTGTFFATTCGTHDVLFIEDSGMDSVLSLHSSCPATTTNQIVCNDDWSVSSVVPCTDEDLGTRRDSSVATQVTVGQVVYIRVASFSTADPSNFVLTVGVIPPNDECADAIVVNSGGTYFGNLTSAFNDGSATCGLSSSNVDLWYEYTATQPGTLQVDTCGTHDNPSLNTGMDTVLSLHSGCPGDNANQLACNDDWSSSADNTACSGDDSGVLRDSYVETFMTPGQTVLIRVSGFSSSRGPFELHVDFVPGALPDSFRRGDCNGDGANNLADVVWLLTRLFPPQGNPPSPNPCLDACDGNDDSALNLADAVAMLSALFGNPPNPLPAPGNGCGSDPTADALDCATYGNCP